MGTWEIILITGIALIVAPLIGIMFMVGRSYGERGAAREYVGGLEAQRGALARQRLELEQQRAALAEQREHLDERRRTERMPDSGRVRPYPGTSGDDQPTQLITPPPLPQARWDAAYWLDMPAHMNKRRHTHRRDDEN